MGLYPVFLKLDSVPCLVVGGGVVAQRKVSSLLEAGALVTVIAPEATPELRALAESGRIRLRKKSYAGGELEGYRLAIAATDSREANRLVHEEAMERGIPVNAVDDPEHSSFFVPAVARRGDLCLAVSTSGVAPYLARRLRECLEARLYPGLEADLARLQEVRARIIRSHGSVKGKKELLERELEPLVKEILARMECS